jgi:hypothetical protein
VLPSYTSNAIWLYSWMLTPMEDSGTSSLDQIFGASFMIRSVVCRVAQRHNRAVMEGPKLLFGQTSAEKWAVVVYDEVVADEYW